ncbi:unnamed protein product, partial [Effrenium voratum]
RRRLADVISFNAAISCTRAAEWALALALLDALGTSGDPFDVVSLNVALASCAQAQRWRQASDLASRFGGVSDICSCNSAVKACEKASRWQQSVGLMSLATQGALRADEITCHGILSSCGKATDWRRAVHVVHQLGTFVELNVISFDAAIAASDKASQWRHVLLLQSTASEAGAEFCPTSLGAMLRAWQRAGYWLMLPQLLQQLAGSFELNATSRCSP